jgi:hypothetical protein
MFTKWTSHLKTKEEREAFQKLLRNTDKRVLERIELLLSSSIQQARNEEIDPSIYDSPSWSHKQAHYNGYVQGLTEALDLILDLKG